MQACWRWRPFQSQTDELPAATRQRRSGPCRHEGDPDATGNHVEEACLKKGVDHVMEAEVVELMTLLQLMEDELALARCLLELGRRLLHEPCESVHLLQEVADEAYQASQPALLVLARDQLLESFELLPLGAKLHASFLSQALCLPAVLRVVEPELELSKVYLPLCELLESVLPLVLVRQDKQGLDDLDRLQLSQHGLAAGHHAVCRLHSLLLGELLLFQQPLQL